MKIRKKHVRKDKRSVVGKIWDKKLVAIKNGEIKDRWEMDITYELANDNKESTEIDSELIEITDSYNNQLTTIYEH